MPNQKQPDISRKDIIALGQIKRILAKGNDVEVRQTKDGTLKVYELRKSPVPVE